MAGSADERAIRDALVAHIHATRPEARVVHELNVNDCRADLAMIEREELTLFEIKSGRDTLARLSRQVETFQAHAHHTIVVADQRWFEAFDYVNGGKGYRPAAGLSELRGTTGIWHWPVLPPKFAYDWMAYPWKMPAPTRRQPHAAKLLGLLWREELLRQCLVAGLTSKARDARDALIERMAWNMTGAEIARAVCAELRNRVFAESDAPIPLPTERTI